MKNDNSINFDCYGHIAGLIMLLTEHAKLGGLSDSLAKEIRHALILRIIEISERANIEFIENLAIGWSMPVFKAMNDDLKTNKVNLN